MSNIYGTGKMIKHVALVGDKRCAVVLQLPEDRVNVHVVDTEALPEIYHQAVMAIIESPEAQTSVWLGDVLARKTMPDGEVALRALYQRNYIKSVPVADVMLSPRPNQHVPLTEVINFMNGDMDVTTDNVSTELEGVRLAEQAKMDEAGKVNQHVQNFAGDDLEQRRASAHNLVIEAEMLEADARRKRETAAALDPSLTTPAVATLTETVEVTDLTANGFVDSATGKSYKTEAALKSAQTRRANKTANS